MKKLLLALLFTMLCAVGYAAEPTQKVILWYQVPAIVLEAQNESNDIKAGQAEFEAYIKEQYSKRFLIQSLKRAPEGTLNPADLGRITRPDWRPIVISIQLAGTGKETDVSGNTYPTVKVAMQESASDGHQLYTYDYGIKEYSSSLFAVMGYIVSNETDTRKHTKNAVNKAISDACKFNDKINRYADPEAYQVEHDRYCLAPA